LPIVVGFFLLAIEYNVFVPDSKESIEKGGVDEPIEPSSQPRSEREHNVSQNPRDVDKDLQDSHRTAMKISSAILRDKELSRLADLALQRNEVTYSVNITGDIWSSVIRNQMYEAIVRQAIQNGDFAFAEKVTRRISSATTRDRLYQEIGDERMRHGSPAGH
jgi:hypothetical protein